MLVERFPVALGVVAGLIVAVTGAFVLSMPVYHSPIDSTLLGRHGEHVRNVVVHYDGGGADALEHVQEAVRALRG